MLNKGDQRCFTLDKMERPWVLEFLSLPIILLALSIELTSICVLFLELQSLFTTVLALKRDLLGKSVSRV